MYPYNHKMGQQIQTNAEGVAVDRWFGAHINIPKALAADADGIVAAAEATSGAEAEDLVITEFEAQPDWARNIVVTVSATTAADVAAGNIVVKGLNIAGKVIEENFAITADTPAVKTGILAFKEVTSVTVPVQDGDSVTVDVGWGDKLGLPYLLAYNTVLKTYFGGTEEATAPTVVVDAAEIEKNTIDLDSTPDGAKDIDIYLIV
jgi:hypothetical protein